MSRTSISNLLHPSSPDGPADPFMWPGSNIFNHSPIKGVKKDKMHEKAGLHMDWSFSETMAGGLIL